ncbi:DUF2269 family protein [Legionella oakridgensis]|uniref:Integral membrane protein n=2 Tax=Legionella oakridgensis TaxID=29423 RepID=A0A0W0X545_9GAMM|nr:DUF2269 domain-containing protein [Legionella oakridgensis]AHE66971.1 putative integral membrane protein [Legionella oakridgensis ATCC 33761 = DSM 21215]ETO93374.1 putative integral membrane protein [Legionella oakridgensis RV-2-2007]KTD39723.1 integral membrane protein [Legionella oakridgensis]STY20073.1 integral membrane protein [Legionella longbeachae]
MLYFILKYVHIISSTLIFGTGLGSAFYMWRANQSKNLQAMQFAARNVVIADWVFTTPAIIIQPITGLWLMHILHYPFTSKWIMWSLGLYVFAGVCWLPVVWLQIKMHQLLIMPEVAESIGLSKRYVTYERLWFYLGWPAFIAVLIIFYLMIFKPI